MITQELTKDMLEEWKSVWLHYKERLKPNRRSGAELLCWLQDKYVLSEIYDKNALDAVVGNVVGNQPYAEKLPVGRVPVPRMFFLENTGKGKALYQNENKNLAGIWSGAEAGIFVGIDLVTGFFMVEGSTMLWEELYAFRGLDEKDLQNYVCVAEYISSLKHLKLLTTVIPD